ncbi:MAG: dephospho-CoA kinase [Rhizobiaceae bacterium]
MTVFLGLTGSIGMGKSTTAQMFRDENVPVHDSDLTVHQLYRGEAAPLIEAAFPGAVSDGVVDRTLLSPMVVGNADAMKRLEEIIHPLVRQKELAFREKAIADNQPLAILDVPLLFETGGDKRADGVIVVTAPAEVQRERVLARPGMTVDKFEAILARQTPDTDKRAKADFIIDTSLGLEAARDSVRKIVGIVKSVSWKGRSRTDA